MSRQLIDAKQARSLLSMAAKAGAIMLENGAETYRVEDSIARICESFDDVTRADVFVTQTAIIASIKFKQESISEMLRIHSRGIDLSIVDAVNQFSRQFIAEKMDLSEAMSALCAIESSKRGLGLSHIFFSSIVGPFYCVLIGAGIQDLILSEIITFTMLFVQSKMQKMKVHSFFDNFSGGLIASVLSYIAHLLNLTDSIDLLIISAIMPLVPGVAITNAVRDTINGDYISGISKFIEAVFSAFGIALGVGTVLTIYLRGGLL